MKKLPDETVNEPETEAEMLGEEMAQEEENAKGASPTATYTLTEPMNFQGETFTTLEFDSGVLTGKDALAIEDAVRKKGKRILIPATSTAFMDEMALRCCVTRTSKGSPALNAVAQKDMPILDYMQIQRVMMVFLLQNRDGKTDEDGIYTQTLQEPVTIHGESVTELQFAPGRLKGSDAQAVMDKIVGGGYDNTTMQEFMTIQFQSEAAARCYLVNGKRVRISSSDLARLPMMDFLAICSEVRRFFIRSERLT